MFTKNCLACGKLFSKPYTESMNAWENRHKFCSRSCVWKFHQNGKSTRFKNGQKAPHPIKKGEHLAPQTQFKKGLKPWNQGLTGVMPPPWNKGKRFDQITGPKHHNWKGGISSLNHLIRQLPEMKVWKKQILQRDKWTCVECGQVGYKLNVDHIKPFSIILKEYCIKTIDEALKCKLLWDIKNGRTLCTVCHRRKTDKFLSRLFIFQSKRVKILLSQVGGRG